MMSMFAAARFFRGLPQALRNVTGVESAPAPSSDKDLSDPLFEKLFEPDDAEFIDACYVKLLDRKADPLGFQVHLTALRSGVPKIKIAALLAGSEEGRRFSDLAITSQKGAEIASPKALLIKHLQAVRKISVRPFDELDVPMKAIGNLIVRSSKQTDDCTNATQRLPTTWVDLTTSIEWAYGVVGIVRAELELACGLKKIDPNIRFSIQVLEGFAEVESSQLQWLLQADNVVDAYLTYFGRQGTAERQFVSVEMADGPLFRHPYITGDTIVSAGWMDSKKEFFFSKLKDQNPAICIIYLIYDMILMKRETAHFYPAEDRARFRRYVEWACVHCDFLLFGGETAKRDLAQFQYMEGWRAPPGQAIRFGSDIAKSVDLNRAPEILNQIGVSGDFIITVGSIEPRKNHDTLYRAYLLALEMAPDLVPQLIICGRPVGRVGDLLDTIERDPRVSNKILTIVPTDPQLSALYANCLFTLLPTIYEGWSLTLPESLGHGKFCLAADTPPLREIGGELIDYIDPFDVRSWAIGIVEYSSDRSRLAERERMLRDNWPITRWQDTAVMASRALATFGAVRSYSSSHPRPPSIWFDITLTYMEWSGHITGIIRTELALAYYLIKLSPDAHFFAYTQGYYFEIHRSYLQWLIEAKDLTTAYEQFQAFWTSHESNMTGHRNPFHNTGPVEGHEADILRFPENSVLFFAGIDMDGTGEVRRTKAFYSNMMRDSVMTSQLLYDFTPMLFPQIHHPWTCTGYGPFVAHVSNSFDHIVYGGKTAQRDGQEIQRKNEWRTPPSDFIEFGSNLGFEAEAAPFVSTLKDQMQLLEMGILSDFVMTVGTLEPRKNHEMLYKAFLHILQHGLTERPLQLVFVGRPGWKTEDFRQILSEDERVKFRIIVVSPSDSQLNLLYRRCMFTLLPSFYEGWSLTLPESLSFGKFCIASDVEPLREIGRDLVEYIHPLDTYRWAERIAHYVDNLGEVRIWESRIREGWHPTTWRATTSRLIEILHNAHRAFMENRPTKDVTTS